MPSSTTRHRTRVPAVGLAVGLAVVASCGGGRGGGGANPDERAARDPTAAADPVIDPGDGGRYRPDVDPADFGGPVDNAYLPYLPGARWVYEGTSDGERERIEVVVTGETRRVIGIDATVVRDTVTVDGEVVEDTDDWFAQDAAGDVWYLGEDSREYEDGEVVSREGSWEAGVGGAQPGLAMPADPEVGRAYRQEYLPDEAEDLAEVLALGDRDTVAGRRYDELLVIEEWNPLEPETVEHKYYAPGVGPVAEEVAAGGTGRVELVSFTPGG